MHASGQSQAYTPSTISVLLLSVFFFIFLLSFSLFKSYRIFGNAVQAFRTMTGEKEIEFERDIHSFLNN